MLEHCSAESHQAGLDDFDPDSQCSRVFDYSSDPHRFAYAPHREAVVEACMLIPPGGITSLTETEVSALHDACAASLVPGDRDSCDTGCYYQASTPEQVVTGQHLRYELKSLDITDGVTGHVVSATTIVVALSLALAPWSDPRPLLDHIGFSPSIEATTANSTRTNCGICR